MTAIYSVVCGFLLLYVLWVYYLAVMSLKRAQDAGKLTGAVRVFGSMVLYPGYLLDALANLTVMTVILLEIPREILVTTRLSRHVDADTWRGKVARWCCSTLLDRFDPSGCHCK